MNFNIKKSIAAAVVLMGMSPAAFAGGVQVDDTSLTDILMEKGVLTKSDVKAIKKNNEGKLKLEALFYLNNYYQNAKTSTATTATSTKTTGLAVDRAYFTAKYSINDDWMMRLTTDMGTEATLGKQQNIYLKYAYAEGKLAGNAAVLRVGQSHTPWIDYEQGLWGHRYVAKVMSDQYGFDTSADLGMGLKGKLMDGTVGYFATVTNGTGYGNGTRTTTGRDYSARIGYYPIDGLTLDVQYYNGYKGTATSLTKGVQSKFYQAMVTYKVGDFRIGANYLNNKDTAKGANTSTIHDGNVTGTYRTAAIGDKSDSTGYDLWATGKLGGGFGAFGRYEKLDNKFTNAAGVANTLKEKVTRFVGGVEYTVVKGVDFSLVYDRTELKNQGNVTTNKRTDDRFGLYSQVGF